MKISTIHILACVVAFTSISVHAAPDVKEVKVRLREVVKAQKNFDRLYAKLSPTQKQQLLGSVTALKLEDSDSDGLPNILEDGEKSGVCKIDSDDDGKRDGSEIEDGQRPNDPDSNDDGSPDGLEAKSRGLIASVTSPQVFSIGDKTWSISATTLFSGLAAADIIVGACVEVEGIVTAPGVYSATQISKEDRCSR